MNLLAELLTNTTAPESGVRLTKKESVIAEKPGPCTYYDKVVVPWSPPLCAHTLANGLPARRWNDGVCTICGGLSPILGLFPLSPEEVIQRNRKAKERHEAAHRVSK